MKRAVVSIIAVVLVGMLVGVVYRVPLSSEEQTIIPARKSLEAVELRAGESLVQRLVIAAGEYSGVVLYADNKPLKGQPLTVVISNKAGDELARGRYARTEFIPINDEILRLEVPTGKFTLIEPGQIFVALELAQGEMALKAARDLYNFGEIDGAGELEGLDLALSLRSPAFLPFGVRQGVTAGAAVALALVLGAWLPRERQRWWLVVVLVAVMAPVALAGYWWSVEPLGIADWDYYFSLHHSYRHSLLEFNAWPFWNPYTCGGTAGLGDPEFPGFTLTFLLELIFGIAAGLRLAIYLSVMVGAWGMLALGKRLGLSSYGALVAALAVAFGTVNLLEITEGHVNIFAAMWIPWVFWAWLGAYRSKSKPNRWLLVTGVFLALTFFQGGIYLLMYAALVFIALIFVLPKPRAVIMVTVKSGLWALGLTAVKLVPVLNWLGQFPDDAYASSSYTLPWLGEILFGRHLHGSYIIPGQASGWHEYGAYVGYVVLGLALIGLSQFWRRRTVRILLLGFVVAALLSTLGPQLEPLFDKLWFFPRSSISRIILLSVIAMGLLAGIGLDHLRERWRVAAWLVAVVVGFSAMEIFSLSYQLSEQAFVLPEVQPQVERAPEPIAFTTERFDPAGQDSRTTRAYAAARAGFGTMAYCSVLGPEPRVRSIFDEGGSVLMASEHSEIDFEVLEWSPNRVRVRIVTKDDALVTLNTNYADGWMANGQPAREVAGLVGADVMAGESNITFVYRSPGFRLGLIISLGTLGLVAWRVVKLIVWWWRSRWAARQGSNQ